MAKPLPVRLVSTKLVHTTKAAFVTRMSRRDSLEECGYFTLYCRRRRRLRCHVEYESRTG